MPNRYRLRGATLADVRRKAELQYGPAARVVSAERVISPGIAGLFSGDYYEAVVEVPEPNQTTGSDEAPREPARFSRVRRGAAAFMGPLQPAPARPAPVRAAAAGPAGPGRVAAGPAGPAARASAGGPVREVDTRDRIRPTPEQESFPAAASHHLQGTAIAALLAEADTVELGMHRPGGAGVSTASPNFAELLEQLGAGLQGSPGPEDAPPSAGAASARTGPAGMHQTTEQEKPATPQPQPHPQPQPQPHPAAARPGPPPAPAPLTGIGDLVLLIGLGEDALDTALAMSIAVGGADVRTAGKLTAFGHLHVEGRQSATAARAQAVMTDRTVLVAYGLERSRDAAASLKAVATIAADQIWVVVDAGRKHEDTERWVQALGAQLAVTALAVIGTAETGTPESVNQLGVPVGWIDSRQARIGQL